MYTWLNAPFLKITLTLILNKILIKQIYKIFSSYFIITLWIGQFDWKVFYCFNEVVSFE